MACNKCQEIIVDSERITCRGYCGKSFHLTCVRLDQSFKEIQMAHEKNVFWMCDGCSDMFTSDHFRNISSRCNNELVPDETPIKCLKDDIDELKQIVRSLSSKVDAKTITPMSTTPWSGLNRMTSSSTVPNTPKRKRVESQPKERPSNIRGSRAASEMVKTVPLPEELFWLYLSAFDPCTSEDNISNFAKNCMGLPADVNLKVVKLVPKDRDPETLSFVTFKVGMNSTHKQLALSKDTWPENVYFREFENQPKNQRKIVTVTAE